VGIAVNVQWWCSAEGEAWSWTWKAYPGVWLFILALGVGYALLIPRGRRPWFGAGLLLLWLALDWPIGLLGSGYLASVHTLQLLLIGYLAPPLLLAGIPPDAVEGVMRRRLAGFPLRVVTQPLLGFAVFNAIIIVTHMPSVVDRLMVTQLGSFTIDLAWLVGGIFLWSPVVLPQPHRPWFAGPVQMIYLFASALPGIAPAAFLTLAQYPSYAVYELAPRVGTITARGDQKVAGLVMWVFAHLILLGGVGVVFFRWSRRDAAELPPADSRISVAEVDLGTRTREEIFAAGIHRGDPHGGDPAGR
jgi:cytochrome c oxidase assembly factor CtaG